ncbi:MAG: protein-disulfide reductase DsbD [Legionellales bacterium]|nr:protein-disulfide reductase DsbD [Legionellales bacterium]
MSPWRCLLAGLVSVMFALPASALTPLPPEQVFQPTIAVHDPNTLLIHWQIAPGYYLYQDQFQFRLEDATIAQLGHARIPTGQAQFDDTVGNYQVLANSVQIPLSVLGLQAGDTQLIVDYLGCSASGFCYPAQQFTAQLTFNEQTKLIHSELITTPTTAVMPETVDEPSLPEVFTQPHMVITLLTFLGLGLLLSFTPCVLPMIPILSSIIVGHGDRITTRKAFILSLIYVISMSLTYAVIGLMFALIGHNLQLLLQTPWVIGITSFIFVLLALAMFGCYELKPPEPWQARIAHWSQRQSGGAYLGVAMMGSLSTLILSPCVTAPLVGALAYIANTGNAIIGASALFVLGLGMGIPLLLIGASAGRLLPKAGPWMTTIQATFGVLLLSVALYLLARILPASLMLLLWGSLLIVCAIYLGVLQRNLTRGWQKLWQGIGIVALVYGITLVIGAAMGNNQLLAPLQQDISQLSKTATNQPAVSWQPVNQVAEVEQALEQARHQPQPILLDFYADWCLTCQTMERNVFGDPTVQTALSTYQLLKADVTAQTIADRQLMQHFDVIAPPTLLFFDRHGQWLTDATLVGEIDKSTLLNHLKQLESREN